MGKYDDLDEAVLVKAHLRRKNKKSKRRTVEPVDFVTILILATILFAAFYFFYQWMASGGWVVIVVIVMIIMIPYILIRWRHRIFNKSIWTAIPPKTKTTTSKWQPIKTTHYPLWLISKLYEARYLKKIDRHDYKFQGSKWEYFIQITSNQPEPSADVSSIKISKRLMR